MTTQNENDSISAWIVPCIIASLGIGMSLAMLMLGIREGATWDWWQVIMAAQVGVGGFLISIPLAAYVLEAWY